MLRHASIADLLAEAARRIQRDPPISTEEERRRFIGAIDNIAPFA